jgi:ribosomal protein S18 acetylase RimI-like enzyme
MPILRPMSEETFSAWVAEAVPAFAAEKIASGQWAPEEALLLSAQAHQALLPQGLATPGHHFFTVQDEAGTAAGMLWFAIEARAGSRVAYVYNIEIAVAFRRRGLARRALAALEEQARQEGAEGIALHVFGHNTGAQALYAELGFRPTNINLYKRL